MENFHLVYDHGMRVLFVSRSADAARTVAATSEGRKVRMCNSRPHGDGPWHLVQYRNSFWNTIKDHVAPAYRKKMFGERLLMEFMMQPTAREVEAGFRIEEPCNSVISQVPVAFDTLRLDGWFVEPVPQAWGLYTLPSAEEGIEDLVFVTLDRDRALAEKEIRLEVPVVVYPVRVFRHVSDDGVWRIGQSHGHAECLHYVPADARTLPGWDLVTDVVVQFDEYYDEGIVNGL
jgi:hypothetical protein